MAISPVGCARRNAPEMVPRRALGAGQAGFPWAGNADSVVFENLLLYNSPKICQPKTCVFEYSDVSGLFTS